MKLSHGSRLKDFESGVMLTEHILEPHLTLEKLLF